MIGQFGINMIVPVCACSFLGILLDKKCETSCFVIILFFVGAAAGFRNIYRFAKKIYEKPSSTAAYLHEGRSIQKEQKKGEWEDEERNSEDKQNFI
jgi:F0F1-type ATP synthase assembly protein I